MTARLAVRGQIEYSESMAVVMKPEGPDVVHENKRALSLEEYENDKGRN